MRALRKTRITALLCCSLTAVAFAASPAHAQTPRSYGAAPAAAAPAPAALPTGAPTALPTAPPSAAPAAATIPVTAQVVHGATGEPMAEAAVFLRAARPRGPFEPTAPEPVAEWTAFTDAAGRASFTEVPEALASQGLRLHALTTHGGVAFESAASAPAPGITLKVEVYEKGLDTSAVVFQNIRTIVEPWEEYLVFTQFYTLTNTGKTAIDTRALPGLRYEKGLPIVLPTKAQGAQITGPGESEVVKEHAYWRGVLKPDDQVQLQIRFSMSARDDAFVYEQEIDYPAKNLEVVVPLQTRFEKLPRLDDVALLAPGFETVESGAGLLDLRTDLEFLVARGQSIGAGESFRFKLTNLPFERPITPWLFLGLGFGCGGAVMLVARRERRRMASTQGRDAVLTHLRAEREELFEELVALELDFEEGLIDEVEYDAAVLSVRERIALVLKKISDLEQQKGEG